MTGPKPKGERLLSTGDGERRQPRAVEHEHRATQPVDGGGPQPAGSSCSNIPAWLPPDA